MVPHAPTESARTWALALGAATPVFLACVLLLPTWPAGLFYDDGIYLVLGQALATGQGLTYLNLPGEHAATHFPPLYPAVLAGLWRFSDSIETVSTLSRLLNALLYGAFSGLLAVAIHRVTSVRPILAGTLAVVGVMATPLVAVALLALSEPLFLLLILPGLWAAERARRPGAGGRAALIAGLIGGLAWLTRSAALPLLVAAVVVYAVERRWRTLSGYLLGAAPLVLGWQLWVTVADSTVPAALGPNYGSYASWYGSGATIPAFELAWRTAALNLFRIPEALGALVVPASASTLAVIAGATLLLLALSGALRLRGTFPVAILALIGYLAIILVWPYNPARFIHTIWPLLVPLGLVASVTGGPTGWRSLAGTRTALAAVLGAGYLVTQGLTFATGAWNLPHRQAAARVVPTLLWVQEHTAPDALIATGLDPAIYLYTGRKAIPPSSWASSDYVTPPDAAVLGDRIATMSDAFYPDYLIIQHRMNQLQVGLDHLLAIEPDRFTLLTTLEDGTRILRATDR